jgi:hypothetical protein
MGMLLPFIALVSLLLLGLSESPLGTHAQQTPGCPCQTLGSAATYNCNATATPPACYGDACCAGSANSSQWCCGSARQYSSSFCGQYTTCCEFFFFLFILLDSFADSCFLVYFWGLFVYPKTADCLQASLNDGCAFVFNSSS